MAIIKKINDNKYWQRCGKGNPCTPLVGTEIGIAIMENSSEGPQESQVHCHIVHNSLYIIAIMNNVVMNYYNHHNNLYVFVYINYYDGYKAFRRDPASCDYMDKPRVMLSKISQTPKGKYCMI